jgi:hypothetical protein
MNSGMKCNLAYHEDQERRNSATPSFFDQPTEIGDCKNELHTDHLKEVTQIYILKQIRRSNA